MQKYHKGDWVRVAKDLGAMMSHFESDCEAIVIHSYNDKFGGGQSQEKSYCIHIKGRGQVSWYDEHQLELIEAGRLDLLEQWEKEKEEEAKQKADLNWVFANGESVLKSAHGATVSALALCLGITNLWGSHGEGFVYYENSMMVLGLASPFLKSGDKDGWLAFCEKFKKDVEVDK